MRRRRLAFAVLVAIACSDIGPRQRALGAVTNVTVDDEQLGLCIAGLANNVSQSYQTLSNTTAREELAAVVSDFASSCLNVKIQPARALRIMAPNTGLAPLLQRHATEYERMTGVKVSLNLVTFYEIGAEARQELQSGLSDFSDGWIIDPGVTGELAALQGFKALDEYIPEDASIEWSDVSRFFRQASAIYDGKVVSIPLDGDLLLMYYRRDLFDRYGLSVPATWDDFVALAERMNGTDTDGDGAGDLYGVCFDNGPPVCKANFLLIAMAAPYLQYGGTAQGLFFDPASMRPLADSAGVVRAAEHYVRLWRLQSKRPSCAASNADFHGGRCLMTINFGDEFNANALTHGSQSQWAANGWSLGVAALPGAAEVYNRTTGQLVPCNSTTTCPYARFVRLANGSTALVNYAPYSAFGGWAGAVSAVAPAAYQRRAYDFFAYLARPDNSWADVLDPSNGINPYRLSQLEVDGANFDRWMAAGYERNATLAYLGSIRDALESGNVVLDSRLEYVGVPYRLMYEFALHNLTWYAVPNGPTVEAVLRGVQQQMEAGLAALGSADELRRQYCRLIGCTASGSGAGGSAAPAGPGNTHVAVAAAVSAAAAACLALAAAAATLMWRRAVRHRRLLSGGVKAPGAGPSTTLLITDIESSTPLWELLPEDVMGRAVEVHHCVIRAALSRFAGYESATEGDSFICAFHSAADAVRCALHIQKELLVAPWPEELLTLAGCPAVAEVAVNPGAKSAEAMALLFGSSAAAAAFNAGASEGSGGSGWRRGRGLLLQQLLPAGLRSRPPTAERLRSGGLDASVGAVAGGGGFGDGRGPVTIAAAVAADVRVTELRAAATAAVAAAATASSDTGASSGAATPLPPPPTSKYPSPRDSYGTRGTHGTYGTYGTHSTYGAFGRPMSSPNVPVSSGPVDVRSVTVTLATAPSSAADLSIPTDAADGDAAGADAATVVAAGPAGGRALSRPVGQSAPQLEAQTLSVEVPLVSAPPSRTGSGSLPDNGRSTAAPPAMKRQQSGSTLLISDVADVEMAAAAAALRAPMVPPTASLIRSIMGLRGTALSRSASARSAPETARGATSGAVSSALPPAAAAVVAGEAAAVAQPLARLCLIDCIRAAWLTPRADGAPALAALLQAMAAAGASQSSGPAPLSTVQFVSPRRNTASQLSNLAQPSFTSLLAAPAAAAPRLLRSWSRDALGTAGGSGGADVRTDPGVASVTGRKALAPQVLFRGLRVRMGIATGVPDAADVSYVPAEARMHYSGSGMRLARAVEGAAAGGQVLLSGSTFAALRSDPGGLLSGAAASGIGAGNSKGGSGGGGIGGGGSSQPLILHMGHHVLSDLVGGGGGGDGGKEGAAQQVYQALPAELAGRLALLPPLRVSSTLALGALSAPVGFAAVCFLYAVGADSLLAWDAGLTQAALALLERAFSEAALAAGGYIVEASNGLLLSAFPDPAAALSCACAAAAAAPGLPWPEGLTEHPLCEELCVATRGSDGAVLTAITLRGLRVKAGLDYGPVRASVNVVTGRLAYRGRVMNRAARIAGRATTGQVLCSRDLWLSAAAASAACALPPHAPVAALPAGTATLKGVPEPVELIACRLAPPPQGELQL